MSKKRPKCKWNKKKLLNECKTIMELYSQYKLEWTFVAQWEQSVIFCGKLLKLWYWIAVFDLNGLVWSCMAWYGLLWQNIVFSRGHRSKFIWSCVYLNMPLKKSWLIGWCSPSPQNLSKNLFEGSHTCLPSLPISIFYPLLCFHIVMVALHSNAISWTLKQTLKSCIV